MADPAPFTLPRDASTDQIPVAGYQASVDATDIIAFGSRSVTETLNTDSNGWVTTTWKPIDVAHKFVIDNGTNRERLIDGASIQAQTAGAAQLFVGTVLGFQNRVRLYQDAPLTIAAASMTGVQVTYVTPVRLNLDPSGNLITVSGGGTGTISDVSDRAARQLGQVSFVPTATLPTDTSDRATRQLGVVAGGIANSAGNAGFVVAPGAGAVICQTATLAAGTYQADVTCGCGGTPTSGDLVNMGFYHGGTQIASGMLASGASGSSPVSPAKHTFPQISVAANERLQVVAIGAASASTQYYVGIVYTRIA